MVLWDGPRPNNSWGFCLQNNSHELEEGAEYLKGCMHTGSNPAHDPPVSNWPLSVANALAKRASQHTHTAGWKETGELESKSSHFTDSASGWRPPLPPGTLPVSGREGVLKHLSVKVIIPRNVLKTTKVSLPEVDFPNPD